MEKTLASLGDVSMRPGTACRRAPSSSTASAIGGAARDGCAIYVYEYRPQPPPSRRAHHDHEPYGVHQHCREALKREVHSHDADRMRLLEETHEAFERLYFDEAAIRCAGLQALRRRPLWQRGRGG